MKYKCSNGVYHNCSYRVVFCTKYRRPVLIDGAEKRLEELIKGVIEETGGEIRQLCINPDYVDMIVESDPHSAVHLLVKRFKAVSSPLLKKEFPWIKSRMPSLWTNTYLITTVSTTSGKETEKFLEEQRGV